MRHSDPTVSGGYRNGTAGGYRTEQRHLSSCGFLFIQSDTAEHLRVALEDCEPDVMIDFTAPAVVMANLETALAAGVAEALVNTAGGLIVGIPARMFYAYFRGRSSKLVSELEAASLDLLTALVGKRG